MKIYTNFIEHQLEEQIGNDPILKNKPITLFYDIAITDGLTLAKNPYNFLFIQEPDELFGYHTFAQQHAQYFTAIFTWSKLILETAPNAYPFYFGAGDKDLIFEKQYQANKLFEVSFMCGPKQVIQGHFLRHKVYDTQPTIEVPTKFYYKGEKRPCWNSMYHIAIENSRNFNYFTEKITDAFTTKTIPLYWGCPNIGDFFNLDGIIVFEDEKDLVEKCKLLTPEYYREREEILVENQQRALQYVDLVGRMKDLLTEVCTLNNI